MVPTNCIATTTLIMRTGAYFAVIKNDRPIRVSFNFYR